MTDPALDAFLGQKPPQPWKRRAVLIILGIVTLAGIFLLTRCFGGEAVASYATQPIERGDLSVTVSATGKLVPTNQVDVGSEQSGLIEQVLVDVNYRVTRGQALAVLDTSRLDDQITQSRAALSAQQATVTQRQATVQEAQAQLNRLREVSRLSGGKVPAKTEMETAEATVARAIADFRASQANVLAARAQLSSDETNRYKAIIRSPVNGVVLAREIDPGQTVAASLNAPVLFTIAEDLTRMELEVSVDEADIGQVKDGQQATFTVDAFPGKTFPATISRVNLGANGISASSSSSASTSSTTSTVVAYTAVLSVSNPERLLRPGMTATADIMVENKRGVMLVPNAALRFSPDSAGGGASAGGGGIVGSLAPVRLGRGGAGGGRRGAQEVRIGAGSKRTVYVLSPEGTPQPVEVTTGSSDGRNTEVTSPTLKPGMQVVTGQKSGGNG
jgi:HlyD family secretion protein